MDAYGLSLWAALLPPSPSPLAAWTPMDAYGRLWTQPVGRTFAAVAVAACRLDAYGRLWTHMDAYGRVWTPMHAYGRLWTLMDSKQLGLDAAKFW